MSRSTCLLFVVLLVGRSSQAAESRRDETDRLFGFTNLWTIRFTLSATDWSAMQPAGFGGPGRPTREFPWRICTFECAGQTLTNVAIRFKGNSSFFATRGELKRPFKLDFNRGQKGRAFLGLEKLSLNNNFNDATQFREALAYDACRRAGLPAPRTAFARVYLTITGARTNELLGLYTLVEPVEDEFLKRQFGTKKGLLLKPEGLRSLDYLGEDWSAYQSRFAPKSEAPPTEAKRFIELTKLIAAADDATFERELPARLDLTNFLRYIAVTALLANYDSFIGNGHNYYLFQPTGGGKVAFIPWDLNEAFGGHPKAGPRQAQAELSVLHPQAGQNRLIERVLANPRWAAAYRHELDAALKNACEPSRLKADAERLARATQETVFAESARAKAWFQRVALGQTNASLPEPGPNAGRPGRGGPFPRETGPGPGGGRGFGPGPGFEFVPGGRREEMPIADWITIRAQNAADELNGKRTGATPRPQGPLGPGGPRGRGPLPPPPK